MPRCLIPELLKQSHHKQYNQPPMKLKVFSTLAGAAAMMGATLLTTSCNDSKSYADLLSAESKAINVFLADNNVILDIPADSVFQTGKDAPYYRLDEEGNVYMQVISAGNKKHMVKTDDQVYFRFTRYAIKSYVPEHYSDGKLVAGNFTESWGNADDLSVGASSFRFQNFLLSSTSQWGTAIQEPLKYLGMYCEVNLVVKSQVGLTQETAQVNPFLYHVWYLPPGYAEEDYQSAK